MQVAKIFKLAPAASAITPPATQQIVPNATRVTTELIVDLSLDMEEA